MVDLDKGKGFHCIMVSMYLVQVALGIHCFLALNSQFLVRQWGFKAASFSVLVLNTKGREINAKATRSTVIYVFQKIIVFWTCLFYENPVNRKRSPLIRKILSCGGQIFLMGKGKLLAFWSKLSWKMVWFAKLKCFVLEVRKWFCFAKINQEVAKWSPCARSPVPARAALAWRLNLVWI
jgi:hypothetical protein